MRPVRGGGGSCGCVVVCQWPRECLEGCRVDPVAASDLDASYASFAEPAANRRRRHAEPVRRLSRSCPARRRRLPGRNDHHARNVRAERSARCNRFSRALRRVSTDCRRAGARKLRELPAKSLLREPLNKTCKQCMKTRKTLAIRASARGDGAAMEWGEAPHLMSSRLRTQGLTATANLQPGLAAWAAGRLPSARA